MGGARRAIDLKDAGIDAPATRGGGVAYVGPRPVEVLPVGPRAAQPRQRATRLRRNGVVRTELRPSASHRDVAENDLTTRSPVPLATGLVVCPMISGLFFGLVSALLVLGSGGVGHAGEVGALVGGVMFASNAAALCIVQSSAQRRPAPLAQSPAPARARARAS